MTAMPEQTWDVITESLALLRAAAAAITDSNRAAPTPCSAWTVTQVLQHAVGDQLAWAAALGVGTGPAENPFEPSGRLEGGVEGAVQGGVQGGVEASVADLVEPALTVARTA